MSLPGSISLVVPAPLSWAHPLVAEWFVSRFGTPTEIAHAIVFLASDESAFTVGSELLIDGGMSNI